MNQKTGNREKPLFVYPSPDEAQRYRRELQDALEAVRERRFPHSDALIWPAGLDRSIVAGLALPEGTHKLLRHAGLMEGDNPLTAHEVLCIPYIGRRAIRDLLVAVDEFLSEYIESFEGRPGTCERRGNAAKDGGGKTHAQGGVDRRAPGAEQTTKDAQGNRGTVWSVHSQWESNPSTSCKIYESTKFNSDGSARSWRQTTFRTSRGDIPSSRANRGIAFLSSGGASCRTVISRACPV